MKPSRISLSKSKPIELKAEPAATEKPRIMPLSGKIEDSSKASALLNVCPAASVRPMNLKFVDTGSLIKSYR